MYFKIICIIYLRYLILYFYGRDAFVKKLCFVLLLAVFFCFTIYASTSEQEEADLLLFQADAGNGESMSAEQEITEPVAVQQDVPERAAAKFPWQFLLLLLLLPLLRLVFLMITKQMKHGGDQTNEK